MVKTSVNEIITNNLTEIKALMRWENYGLNNTIIPVEEALQNDAISTLRREYGRILIEEDEYAETYDYLMSDIFMYFPILMQELSITRLIDAYAVATHDNDTEKTTTTSTMDGSNTGTETLVAGTSVSEILTGNSTDTSTGTVKDVGEQTSRGTSNSLITNESDIEETGGKSVNFTHALPEQAIDGTTKKFPVDEQGTPNMGAATVNLATESFNTSNPMGTLETSEQESSNDGTVTNDNTTTNDLTNSSENNSSRTASNSGSDLTTTQSNENVTTSETVERELNATNKQYAYEVSAFIKTAGEVVAFQNWKNRFSWIGGII